MKVGKRAATPSYWCAFKRSVGWPARLLYDRAANADWLRDALGHRGVQLICPHRRGRKKEIALRWAKSPSVSTPQDHRTIHQLAVSLQTPAGATSIPYTSVRRICFSRLLVDCHKRVLKPPLAT